MSSADITEIIDLVKSKNFQIACRKHFEATHPKADANDVGNHPNAWFDASRRYYDEKAEEETESGSKENKKAKNLDAGAAAVSSFTMPVKASA